MSAAPTLEDLERAAAAAGFAMVGNDPDLETNAPSPSRLKSQTAEDLARGARTPKSNLPALAGPLAPASETAKGRLATGAQTVRESVYGYLRFGIPA